jgi:ribosome-binding protein aMBF1 (putative translation factor)
MMPVPDRIHAALKTLRWSNCALAAEVRRDEKQVRRWLAGTHQPSTAILDWLERLAEHHRANPAP